MGFLDRLMGRGANPNEQVTRVQEQEAREPSREEEARAQAARGRARQRVAVVREFQSFVEARPETLYGTGRREDAVTDFLLGEIALDLLPKQETSHVVERDLMEMDQQGETVARETYTLPAAVRIAGQTLEVGELLGAGGFGAVCESGSYALKFIPVSDVRGNNFLLASVAREISALARFNPLPNGDRAFLDTFKEVSAPSVEGSTTDRIPGFLGATRVVIPDESGESRKEFIVVAMERVRGEDLSEAMFSAGTSELVTPDTYRELLQQMASALDPFHALRILHRDVKPSNIMVDFAAPGKVEAKLTDMGLMVDADYWRRWRTQTAHKELVAAVSTVRTYLLELSLDNTFIQSAEETWLELAALLDRVEAGEDMKASDLSFRVTALMQDLPQVGESLAKVATAAARAGEADPIGAFGTLLYLDNDALQGEPTSASDIFALGLSVTQFLATIVERRRGRRINDRQALALAASSEFFSSPAVISELGEGERGQRMAELLSSMLAHDASARPQNARAVLEALAH